tara:strand:+ start:276 stop:488 length:213 start_codon:yes stop_codon:yes gene_type:complete
MKKQDLSNKKETPDEVKNKAPKKAKIDFSKLGSDLEIVAGKDTRMVEGKIYKVSNNIAKVLIEKGAAKLK